MKRTILAVGLMAAVVPFSTALADVSEDRDLEAFDRVEFDGLMEIHITAGEEQSFKITANKEKYLSAVTTRVRNGVLRVDMDVDDGFFQFLREIDVTIEITVPVLNGVEMDGLGDLTIKNVDSDAFEMNLDGMGSVTIDGRCKSARFNLDGMGDLKARKFECERVRLIMDGMGDADIYASEAVDIELDGFGDVEVYGDPKERSLNEDGMGDIDFN